MTADPMLARIPIPSERLANRAASRASVAGRTGIRLRASSATVVPSAPLVSEANGGCTGWPSQTPLRVFMTVLRALPKLLIAKLSWCSSR